MKCVTLRTGETRYKGYSSKFGRGQLQTHCSTRKCSYSSHLKNSSGCPLRDQPTSTRLFLLTTYLIRPNHSRPSVLKPLLFAVIAGKNREKIIVEFSFVRPPKPWKSHTRTSETPDCGEGPHL